MALKFTLEKDQVLTGSRALFNEIRASRVALLLWTDKVLVARARARNLGKWKFCSCVTESQGVQWLLHRARFWAEGAFAGHNTPDEAIEDAELRELLEARQAAYLTLVMGVH